MNLTKEQDDQQLFPYPEWNKGQKGIGWKVIQGEGAHIAVGPKVKDIVVPLDGECALCGEPHAHGLRLHEQAHIRFTLDRKGRHPKLPPNLKDIYWQVAEDIRMDMCLRSVGVKTPPILCRYEAPKWKAQLAQMNDKGRILWVTATAEMDKELTEKWIREVCKDQDPGRMPADEILDIAELAEERMQNNAPYAHVYWPGGVSLKDKRKRNNYPGGVYFNGAWEFPKGGGVPPNSSLEHVYRPPLKNSIAVAQWLQLLMEQLGFEPPPQPQQQGAGKGKEASQPDPETHYDPNAVLPEAEAEEQGVSEEDEAKAEQQAQAEAQKSEEEATETAEANPNSWGGGDTGWEEFVIEYPVLPRRLPGRLIQHYRPTDAGAIVGSMHRWFTDQKVFKEKRRWPGGVVVVDCSGSMGLSYEQVAEIVEAVPGVMVVLYGSRDGGRGDGKATLRVVAKEGKWGAKDTIAYSGGYNGIDGPALHFGVRAPIKGPRVWLSDGWVNGTGSVTDTVLRKEVELLIRRNNIIHVNPHFVYGVQGSKPKGNDPKVIERVIDALRSGKGGGRYFVNG